jgi:hypothetical protein
MMFNNPEETYLTSLNPVLTSLKSKKVTTFFGDIVLQIALKASYVALSDLSSYQLDIYGQAPADE